MKAINTSRGNKKETSRQYSTAKAVTMSRTRRFQIRNEKIKGSGFSAASRRVSFADLSLSLVLRERERLAPARDKNPLIKTRTIKRIR
jgi:hypothetical protein